MTAPRIARANRIRLVVGLGVFVLAMGFIAVFHSSQTELDDLKLHCAKQQDSLNTQMLMLEKSLKLERFEHQQTKRELRQRSKEMKELNENTLAETNGKFAALQQSYKLLKIQNEDLNESCEKKRDDLLERIQKLEEAKGAEMLQLKRQNAELKAIEERQSVNAQTLETALQASKAAALQANNEVRRVQFDVEQQLVAYRSHCSWRPADGQATVSGGASMSTSNSGPKKQFKAQVASSDNLYTVDVNTVSVSTSAAFVKKAASSMASNRGVILNSVENFQIIPKPVMINPPLASESIPKLSSVQLTNDEQSIDQLKPAPAGNRLSSTTAASTKMRSRQVPKGVVPMLPNLSDDQNAIIDDQVATMTAASLNGEGKNNRYAGILEDIGGIAGQVLGIHKDLEANAVAGDVANMVANLHQNDVDNGANEINDEFQLDTRNHKDHLVDSEIKLNGNNAAEEDTNNNLFDNKALAPAAVHTYNLAKPNLRIADDVDGIGEVHVVNGGGGGGGKQMESNKKLINEIDADQGKVAEYPDDVHLEEQVEEEDDDEYENPAIRKQEPAVRN